MRPSLLIAPLLLLSAPLAGQSRAPDFDALAKETTAWLSDYLKIRSINPPGNELEGARWLQAVLAREGIASEVLESAPGRGNLVARLRGTGRRRPLVLLSHIDVVPATADAWAVDPFGGVVRDGYVWGRGALDMKGLGIVELATFVALKRRGVPLSRDLILVANADEETGSSGAQWLVRERPDLVKDAEFLINEGGANRVSADGRTEFYGVAVTEKVPFWLRLTARGTPGHGSRPTPDNPVARISRALGRIVAHETPLRVTPPVEALFKDLSTREQDPRRRRWLADPAAALSDTSAVRFFTGDLYYNAILRNTITPTGMAGSEKTNVIPPVATADLDVRLLPGTDPADFLAELRAVVDDSLVEIAPLSSPRVATTSPVDGALMAAVREAVQVMEWILLVRSRNCDDSAGVVELTPKLEISRGSDWNW